MLRLYPFVTSFATLRFLQEKGVPWISKRKICVFPKVRSINIQEWVLWTTKPLFTKTHNRKGFINAQKSLSCPLRSLSISHSVALILTSYFFILPYIVCHNRITSNTFLTLLPPIFSNKSNTECLIYSLVYYRM